VTLDALGAAGARTLGVKQRHLFSHVTLAATDGPGCQVASNHLFLQDLCDMGGGSSLHMVLRGDPGQSGPGHLALSAGIGLCWVPPDAYPLLWTPCFPSCPYLSLESSENWGQ
jgi:hypothetical protein